MDWSKILYLIQIKAATLKHFEKGYSKLCVNEHVFDEKNHKTFKPPYDIKYVVANLKIAV